MVFVVEMVTVMVIMMMMMMGVMMMLLMMVQSRCQKRLQSVASTGNLVTVALLFSETSTLVTHDHGDDDDNDGL